MKVRYVASLAPLLQASCGSWNLAMDLLCHWWPVWPWVSQSRPQGNYSLYRGSTHSHQSQVYFCFVSCDFALWTLVIFNTLIFLRHCFIIAFQAINWQIWWGHKQIRAVSSRCMKFSHSSQSQWLYFPKHPVQCDNMSFYQPATRNNNMSLWMLFLRGNDNALVFAQITENRCAVKLIPLICINRCISKDY